MSSNHLGSAEIGIVWEFNEYLINSKLSQMNPSGPLKLILQGKKQNLCNQLKGKACALNWEHLWRKFTHFCLLSKITTKRQTWSPKISHGIWQSVCGFFLFFSLVSILQIKPTPSNAAHRFQIVSSCKKLQIVRTLSFTTTETAKTQIWWVVTWSGMSILFDFGLWNEKASGSRRGK